MVSRRQQILTAIKGLVEANGSIYDSTITVRTKINVVNDEPTKPRRGKPTANRMDVWCPDDIEAEYESHVNKNDTGRIPIRIRIALPNHHGDNDHVYQIMEDFRTMIWANHTLGLSFVSSAHIDSDVPRVKPKDVTLVDGAIISMTVLTREAF